MRNATILSVVLMVTLLLTIIETGATQEIYRWVDENGVVHFGDQPDAQEKAERVEIQPPPADATDPYSAPDSSDAGQSEPSYAQQQRDERARKRKEAEDRRIETANLCAQAQIVVAKLEPMPRVLVTKPDGTVERMDDNDRLEKLGEAKRFIAENCKQ